MLAICPVIEKYWLCLHRFESGEGSRIMDRFKQFRFLEWMALDQWTTFTLFKLAHW